MKKAYLFFALIAFAMLWSCDGSESGAFGSAEDVMKQFIQKVKDRDFEGAKEFSSSSTDKAMDFLAKRIQVLEDMGKKEDIIKLFGDIDFSQATATCTEEGNKANCQICQEGNDKCKDISLIKEGGNWRVHMPKETTADK